MYVAALSMELHIPAAGSLKAKRSVVRHLVETARQRHGVSAAEVSHHDLWQRAGLGFCVVAATAAQAEERLDRLERFILSHPQVEVISTARRWLETG